MNRKEAESVVGKQVSAWTAMNGIYAGELVEVIAAPRRPWRAKVRITGIQGVAACTFDRSGRQRWGKRIGDIIEVGGSSVRELAEGEPEDLTYLTVLRNNKAAWEARIPQYEAEAKTFAAGDPNDPWTHKHLAATEKNLRLARWTAKELAKLIEEEPARLARMAASGAVATTPRRAARDHTVPEALLTQAMAKDSVRGDVVTLVNTRGGIAPIECLASGIKDDTGTLVAAYIYFGGRACPLDLNEETLREA